MKTNISKTHKTLVSLVILLNITGVLSFSVSVPPVRSVCKTMVPGHDKFRPQTSTPPFNVTIDKTNINSGDIIELTLYARDGRFFKGFYVQARDTKGKPIGAFNANTLVKTHSCGGIRSNAAHHVSPDNKTKIQVSWKSPEDYKGDIQIQATMVEKFNTFWTPIKAEVITVN